MGLLRIYIALMGGVLLVGVFLSACGGVEPSFAEPPGGSFAVESKGTRVDERRASGQGKSDVFDAGALGDVVDEADSVEGEDDGCLEMCAMLDLCHGLAGVVDFDGCRAGCAQSMYDGVLMARDLGCVAAASDCGALSDCMEDFWGCDEPCNAFMQCEIQEEPDECRLWCGVGIGSGAVRIEQFHCMERVSNMLLCDELVEACELGWMF